MEITATYSPEDNKIRLYASTRLDQETFDRVKAAGFKWAPKQELFVAPKWTPEREDLAIELAGEINAEEMTLAERAAMKAERLDALAQKRENQANAFATRANELSQAFHMGQPILVGHHSERKARKTKEKMHAAASQAVKAADAVGYWLYRADGVERHANRKNDPRVRARRIKTLLADMRSMQRAVNDSAKAFELWKATDPESLEEVSALANMPHLSLVSYRTWSYLQDGKITPQEVHARALAHAQAGMTSRRRARFIEHYLNRLSYERELLGTVPLYDGQLTPAILQTFAREHGAERPKATNAGDVWTLESPVDLPAHFGNGTSMELTPSDWAEFMQSVGYTVPAKKDAAPSILNFEAATLDALNPYHRNETVTFRQVKVTKAQYSKIPNDYRGTRLSSCGQFRFKIALSSYFEGEPRGSYVAVFLSDSKVHDKPESMAIDALQEAA